MLKKSIVGLFLSSLIFIYDAGAQTGIRQVDFQNFTYEPFCIGEETSDVTVKGGEFSEEKEVEGYTERFYFSVTVQGYGDIDGDGREEAVINSICNTGGTGNFSEGFVYTMKNGKPALLARIEGGDRAHGGIREIKVEKNLVIVQRNDVGELGGACCPEYVVTSRYKRNGKEHIAVGKDERRELYPSKRVEFAKGTSRSTFKVNFSPDEDTKRFVVGARKGQTMRVFSDTKNVYIDIRLGDAKTSELANGISARLNETGDFIIQVQYPTDIKREISLTIEIK